MSAQFDPTPGLHLPQPSLGGAQVPAQHMIQIPQQPQQPSFPAPQGPQPPVQGFQPQSPQPVTQQPMPAPQPPMIPPSAQALPIEQLQQQPELQAATQPVVADNEKDGDALDEEWIAKTKALIEQYKNDPYALSNALSALKADYLKMRHGVIVKVDNKA